MHPCHNCFSCCRKLNDLLSFVVDLGLQQHRLDGEEYLEVVDEFMEAVFTRWPNVIVQVCVSIFISIPVVVVAHIIMYSSLPFLMFSSFINMKLIQLGFTPV